MIPIHRVSTFPGVCSLLLGLPDGVLSPFFLSLTSMRFLTSANLFAVKQLKLFFLCLSCFAVWHLACLCTRRCPVAIEQVREVAYETSVHFSDGSDRDRLQCSVAAGSFDAGSGD